MVKRKVSNGNAKSSKKQRNASNSNDEKVGQLDCTKPEKSLSSLIGTHTVKEFFTKFWEKQHLFIRRKDLSFYQNLFTLGTMKDILSNHELLFESDVNVCRYVNGEKELLNEDGQITKDKFENLMKEKKATFQFHQPQRYVDGLWNLMEKLETYFGSLVGSNVYITPESSQGLAPHCDDVEIFVMQLEGKKTWKLYKPMVELSRDYTQDLLESDIGEPFFEETLEPGDLLYFPRGTIHQAKTSNDGYSVHISLSTYQQQTWGDFMNHAVTQAIENALEDDVATRSGLPVNYLSFLGTSRNLGKYVEDEIETKTKIPCNDDDRRVVEFKEKIKSHLSKLIDHIDVNTAADAMCADFMASRLPPYGHQVTEDSEIDRKVPTLENKIKIKFPDHVRVVYCNEDDVGGDDDMSQLDDDDESDMEEDTEDEKPAKEPSEVKTNKKDTKRKSVKSDTENEEEEDDEDVSLGEEEPYIKIVHSLNNPREAHMCGVETGDFTGMLKLPVHFGKAAIILLESKDFVCVKDLALEENDDKLTLAATLFSDDLIEVQ